ncbi:MAG TPA: pitrilysin family protein [Candidatus Acidoferrales bacterium]
MAEATSPQSQLSSAANSGVPALGTERPVVWPQRTYRKLANGLEVVLVESHIVPKFTGELYFRAGNAAVADVAPGLAEITATVVRTGTQRRSSRQIEEDSRRMGADFGTSAGADTSAIAFSGLVDFAPDLLALVADLACNASFPVEEFEHERRQMVEGLRIERTTPSFLGGERLRHVLFGAHPYSIVSPTEAQVEAYRREQLIEFYRAHYGPSHALLVLVGDFSSEKMLGEIERIFGSWTGPAVAPPPNPPLPNLRGRHVHLVHLQEAVQAQVFVGNMAITRKHPDWLRLGLANSIYGGAFNSRLVMNIREAKGYTYSPRSGVHALRQHGYFSIHAAVRNEVVAATLTEIFYEMDRMRALPVGDDELADARNYLSGIFSLGLATQDGLAGQLSGVYLERLPADYLETYRERIRALTAQDVLAAARAYFDSANAQIVVVGDRRQIAAQAELFGDVTEYPAQEN